MIRFNLTKYTIYFYYELKNSYLLSCHGVFDKLSVIEFFKYKFDDFQFKNFHNNYQKIYE